MSKKNIIFSLLLIFMFFNMILVFPASAQNLGIEFASNLGLQNSAQSDPRDMAVDIVKYLMTFLGIIAVAVILYGGFIWMTASGNDDRVDKAKKLIIAGAIGLIIILAAFAIVQFVVTMTNNALEGTF